MTMLDRCARALCLSKGGRDPECATTCALRGQCSGSADEHIHDARAVLEALRDPTPEMIAAIWAKIDDAKKAAGIARLGPGPGVRDVINAYIDEALKERT
jgi:hypothetical protein